MKNMLMIDHHKCVGCKNCEMVCSLVHEGICAASLSRIRVAKDERAGWNVPITCAMCEKPLCVTVCPVGAASRNPVTGLVTFNEQKCIGCRQCIQVCPFSHANFNQALGVAFKCDQCEGEPQCVKYCPSEAITFEPLEIALHQRRQETAQKIAADTLI